MKLERRDFLLTGVMAALAPSLEAAPASSVWRGDTPVSPLGGRPDHTLHIATGLVELSPEHIISTTLYNGVFPGPLIRLKEGRRVVIDIQNETDIPELVHWHGQKIPSEVDGAYEEGTPFVPPRSVRRISFVPGPAGFRFVHTHVAAGNDLARGTYTGQAAPLYIEPAHNPGAFDREVFLVLKEFAPSFSRGGDMALDALAGAPLESLERIGKQAEARFRGPEGYEVGYDLFSINGRMLGHGEPIRVKQGERVLFHVLNASAGEIRSLALPGHTFRVVALDGNPVPAPAEVPVLWLGTAERVSAIVEMNHPGVWVMGDLADDDRQHGMGIVVEYAGRGGKPQWLAPKPFHWDYTNFGHERAHPAKPDETIEMLFVKENGADGGFNRWLINGEAFSMTTMKPNYTIQQGRRYRLRLRNASDDIHPLHLHRHTFELTRVSGKPTSGVMKDVVMLGGYQELELDFVADNPGLTLFHCHQQLHMDFGFMALFRYAHAA